MQTGPDIDAVRGTAAPARRFVIGAWALALPLMLAMLGAPVLRTQEARVLETAREMLDAGGGQWLIPQLNDRPRLEKPPLAYWLAAGGFRAFGVGATAGRVPMVVVGWLTLAPVYFFAGRLFGRRAGVFAAAMLGTSLMFFTHARLAETDVLANAAIVLANYATWRGAMSAGTRGADVLAERDARQRSADADNSGETPEPREQGVDGATEHPTDAGSAAAGSTAAERRDDGSAAGMRAPGRDGAVRGAAEWAAVGAGGHALGAAGPAAAAPGGGAPGAGPSGGGWLRLSGVAIGVVVLAKGLPAVFPVLFLMSLAAFVAGPGLLRRWLTSGAPLLAIVIGSAWYAYVAGHVGAATFYREFVVGVRGGEHRQSLVIYFPALLAALAPWTGFVAAALVAAAARWRATPAVRAPLLWAGTTFVPLLLGGQKQAHYLLPVLPPLAMLAGGWVDRAIADVGAGARAAAGAPGRDGVLVRAILIATLGASAAAGVAAVVASAGIFPTILPAGSRAWLGACAVGLVAVPVVATIAWRRRGVAAALVAAMLAWAVVLPVVAAWAGSLRQMPPDAVARRVRAAGPGPFCSYGPNVSVPLIFSVRETMPQLVSPDALSAFAAGRPGLVVVAQAKSGAAPPPVPAGFRRVDAFAADDQQFELYRPAR